MSDSNQHPEFERYKSPSELLRDIVVKTDTNRNRFEEEPKFLKPFVLSNNAFGIKDGADIIRGETEKNPEGDV